MPKVYELQKASALQKLDVRRDPYWGAPLARGQHVGYRKLDPERATWIARFYGDDKKYQFRSLGYATPTFQFDEAKKAAAEWFASLSTGIIDMGYSVTHACEAYVAACRTRQDGQKVAYDAECRFKRLVYGTRFGNIPLSKLSTVQIKAWRTEITGSDRNRNRNMTPLRAALNLAVENKKVAAHRAIEWANVKQFADTTDYIAVMLDVSQRRAFLKAAGEPGTAFYDFIMAYCLTGARPGEIAKMQVRQFNSRHRVATFIGKTRKKVMPRTVPLHDEAVALFARHAKGKAPTDLLFTREDGSEWIHYNWHEIVTHCANVAGCPPGTTLMALRHSFITESLMADVSILEVSKLAGTSIAMIQKTYGHLIADRTRANLNRVELV
jgi:integrase